MKTHEKIKKLFDEKGRGSQIALATLLGLDKGFVSRWKNGSQEIPRNQLKAVADYFGVTTDYLLDEEQETPLGKVIPIIGDSTDDVPTDLKRTNFEYMPIPLGINAITSYAIIAKGNSMLPLIADGDTVICDTKPARSDNSIVHYTIDGKSGIKRIKHLANGSRLLIPENNTDNNYDVISIQKSKIEKLHTQTAVCIKIFKKL